MYVCSVCGKTFANHTSFCDNCGNPVTYQSVPAQPHYTVPAHRPAGSRGKHIAGMVLGISGMVLALIGLLYCLILLPEASDSIIVAAALGGVAIGFSIFSLPLSIVGLALCNRKAFGMVGTIVSGILLLLAIIYLSGI